MTTHTRLLAVLASALFLPPGLARGTERVQPFPAYYPSPQEKLDSTAAMVEAVGALSEGELEKAVEQAREAVRLTPTAASPHFILGMAAEQGERVEDAIGEYRETLAWNPEESRAVAALERLEAPRHGDVVEPFEEQMVRLMNQARAEAGVPELKPHPALRDVARGHSAAMRDLGFFSHTSPKRGHTKAIDRFLERFDGNPKAIGENVSRRWTRPEPALNEANILRSHIELMNSPGHRANILGAAFVYVAVGIATNPQGDYWITQMFMTPRSRKSAAPVRRPAR